ncbi:MAG: universal stress protein, partial [Bacteroidales bacterium]|nr:universal stress protein [Bacteroidales bacterium]
MSQIIVGVDFSNSSLTALRLAIDVANRTGANVLIAWVKTKDINVEDAQEALQHIVNENEKKLNGKKLSYEILEGRVYQAFTSLAKR